MKLIKYLRKLEPWIVILLLYASFETTFPPPFGNFWDKATTLGTYLFIPLFTVLRWKKCTYVATRDMALLLLTIMAVFSVFWSATPTATVNYAKALIRTTMFGIYLATCYSSKEQMRLLIWVSGITVIFSLFYGLAMPSFGISGGGEWKGVFAHKNYLARAMVPSAVLFVLQAINNRRYRWIGLIGFGLSVLLLLLSQGKTALVVLLFSLSLLPFYSFVKQYYKLRIFLLLIAIVLGGIATTWISLNIETIIVDKLGKDMGLNGRVELWTVLIERGLTRPWFGFGYGGFWTNHTETINVSKLTWLQVGVGVGDKRGHAHNGFIDLFLQLGWMGAFLLTLTYLSAIIKVLYLISYGETAESFWMLKLLLMNLIFNYATANTLISNGHLFWILYISISLSASMQFRQIRKKHNLKILQCQS